MLTRTPALFAVIALLCSTSSTAMHAAPSPVGPTLVVNLDTNTADRWAPADCVSKGRDRCVAITGLDDGVVYDLELRRNPTSSAFAALETEQFWSIDTATQALPVLVNDETVSVHGIRPVGGVIVVARMDDPAMPPASLAQR